MLKFQWNGLRRGDTVFIHDPSDADLGLRAGVVTLIDVGRRGPDVGIRLTTSTPNGRVIRPGRFAVHLAAVNDDDCWRCSDNRPQRRDIGVAPRPRAQSRSMMAVALLSTPASMTAEQYCRITEQLDASRSTSRSSAPPGSVG